MYPRPTRSLDTLKLGAFVTSVNNVVYLVARYTWDVITNCIDPNTGNRDSLLNARIVVLQVRLLQRRFVTGQPQETLEVQILRICTYDMYPFRNYRIGAHITMEFELSLVTLFPK